MKDRGIIMHVRSVAVGAAIAASLLLAGCGSEPAEKPRVMAPINVATGPAEIWTPCAADGGTCTYEGLRKVRFGAGNAWFHRTANSTIRCDATMFGDPAPKAAKGCEVKG